MRTIAYVLTALCLIVAAPAYAGDHVIASIKPLHSLVAAVMQGDDNAPLLLVGGAASPHTFTLRPSQMRALAHADVVFYMGNTFELFLRPALPDLPPGAAAPMENAPGVTLYPLRVGGGFNLDKDDVPGSNDLHLWLSPHNARAMAAEIARRLEVLYPSRAALYRANLKKLDARLTALDGNLRARLKPLAGRTFVVFHDAYQYFEKAYGLSDIGAITLDPSRSPGAKHLIELRARIRKVHAACVFREPQFNARLVDNLIAGTGAKSALLDPEGALLKPGPDLYFTLMDRLAAGFTRCLGS